MPTPTETVTLRNATARMLPPIHVAHAEVCAARGECMCQRVAVGVRRRGLKGEVATSVEVRRLPVALTLCARGTEGDELHDLPLEVLHASEVKAAIAAGLVAVERVKAGSPGPKAGSSAPLASPVSASSPRTPPAPPKPPAPPAGDPAASATKEPS